MKVIKKRDGQVKPGYFKQRLNNCCKEVKVILCYFKQRLNNCYMKVKVILCYFNIFSLVDSDPGSITH